MKKTVLYRESLRSTYSTNTCILCPVRQTSTTLETPPANIIPFNNIFYNNVVN